MNAGLEIDSLRAKVAIFDEMLAALRLTIGFCVSVRQTDPEWFEHQDVGVLYAAVDGVFRKANKIAEAKQ